ncbi:MAG TPA: OsmC family protein [Bacteroidales bacterium]|jgi:putative redox protein|nr:OsmC family protein [Bacteroidales bacterium]MDI9592340.1 OsmC family protein [Bacteroidota bacterium]NLH32948.1 OsmC family protein [Lentimicrobium sp.]MBP7874358.1 OsmC family protein [Bacteroidales bacterium]MCO6468165.1 OsmC family protein [Bacteroidales bacterium]
MDKYAEVTLNRGMSFDVEVNGHKFLIDADEKVGGENRGPRPKPLLLAGLGGCTGMDVISILRKMRVEPEYFNVVVLAESTNEHPMYYKKIHIEYQFRGKDLPMDKLEKAVNLSQERYCGVSFMLGKASEITSEIKILD